MALSERDSAYFKSMTKKQLDDYETTLADWEITTRWRKHLTR